MAAKTAPAMEDDRRSQGALGTGASPAGFTVRVATPRESTVLARGDVYSAALAFLDGRIDIEGDFITALRELTARQGPPLRRYLYAAFAGLYGLRLEAWYQSRARARRNIQFHYDHDPGFYRQFLDERLVYSCAYFDRPDMTLEEAQQAKLDHICRKLDLQSGETFLDIGCGFGALVAHAAEQCGATATGCTLSQKQFDIAGRMLRERGLQGRASVKLTDYRDLGGEFAKAASVGMFEHVGLRRLRGYFSAVHAMLAPDGLFLNHGIARPETVRTGAEWVFLQRYVFPGGELPHLSEVVREAEKAGFEVLDVENLRPHYARTCRAWVERLMQHRDACEKLAGRTIHRIWLLYLAVSALSFESGHTEVHQVLLAKRGSPRRHWTRRYIYA